MEFYFFHCEFCNLNSLGRLFKSYYSENLTVCLVLLETVVVTKYRNKVWHGVKSKHGQKHPREKHDSECKKKPDVDSAFVKTYCLIDNSDEL